MGTLGFSATMRCWIPLSIVWLVPSFASDFLNKLIPSVDFDHEECIGDACFLKNQVLQINRAKKDKSGKLTFNEVGLGYVSTQNLLDVCLPGVKKENVAEHFKSCDGKKMEEVCTFAKRGWLKKDANEDTVTDIDLLKSMVNGLDGGEESVKKCVKVKEENAAYDDDYSYEYDYYDYYDPYDYLEEMGRQQKRLKRETGKEGKGKGKNKKKNGKKSRKSKSKKKKNKGGRNSNKGNKSGKTKGKKNNKKGRKNNTKGKKNNKKGNKKGKNDRKYVNKPNKESSPENTAKITAKLAKLGFTKLP